MAPKTYGFSAVISIIVIVVVIGVLGFIGWRLYSQSHTTNGNATANNQSTSRSPINSTNQTTSPADPNAGYFVIKEWGVRFKLPADLTGLEYKLANFSDEPSDSYADFYTTQLASLVPDCNPLAGSWSVGLIRLARYPISNEQPITGFSGRIASLGGYNYYYGGNQAVCPDDQTTKDTAASIKLLQTDDIELINAVKSLEEAEGTYLNIKELGIKLPLSNDIKDLIYTYSNINGVNYIHFTTQSIIAADPTCNASSDPIGTYTVFTTEQPNPGPTDNEAGILEAHVNGYYIYYGHAQYACGNSTAAPLVSAAAQSLLTAIKNAQAQ